MNTALPVLFLLASARAQAEPPCSLNGKASTVNGKASCVCDKPWSGALCETMNFKPATYPQGYGMAPNLTSWGGNTIYDAASKEYHIYVSAMTNHCPLQTWGKNSRIDHGVSKTITGPYALRDVAINTWAHNSAPIALKDGTFAIVHIGTGTGPPNGGQNCNKSAYDGPLLAPDAADAHTTADSYVASTAGGSTIHTAKSLAGPWEPLMKNTLGGCNNPAPWVHPNGTIFCVCGGSLKSAESICGPWTTVTSFSHKGGPAGNYEDPFLYTDHNGHFHLIYHVYVPKPAYTCINSTVSAHAFSEDGFNWHMSATSPYGTQIATTAGTVQISTRERPKIYFDTTVTPWKMTHLFNGVCSSKACPPPGGPHTGCVDCKYKGWDYTLIAPLDV